jgi:hypothetical protein
MHNYYYYDDTIQTHLASRTYLLVYQRDNQPGDYSVLGVYSIEVQIHLNPSLAVVYWQKQDISCMH